MGVFCEICLTKPTDGRYAFQPGSLVSGRIRYYIDQEYEFTSITASLKGVGQMYFHDRLTRKYYTNEEIFVDISSVLNKIEKDDSVPDGQYEIPISFRLPNDIPGSLNHRTETVRYNARCLIQYCVRIKFKRLGLFNMNKSFRKEINVISGQIPRRTTNPLIYGHRQTLRHLSSLFSNKKSFVDVKAAIANSVLRTGESVKVDYDIENNSNADIRRIEINLQEVDKYTAVGGEEPKSHTDVKDTIFTFGAIKRGETVKFTAEILVPDSCGSIDHSKIMSRDYSVLTIVVLPTPHKNISLEIPFQVNSRLPAILERSNENIASTSASEHYSDYWEEMVEEKTKSPYEQKVYSFRKLETVHERVMEES